MIYFLPKSKLGKWSIFLMIGFFLFLSLLFFMVSSGQRGGKTFFSNPYLATLGLLAVLCGIISFFIGLLSIIKEKERSVLVFISFLVGLFVIIFILGELLSAH